MICTHAELSDSTHTSSTCYGTFYICAACVAQGHMPPIVEYRRHPLHDTKGCECEHVDHAKPIEIVV
jgi:hypothetical protein